MKYIDEFKNLSTEDLYRLVGEDLEDLTNTQKDFVNFILRNYSKGIAELMENCDCVLFVRMSNGEAVETISADDILRMNPKELFLLGENMIMIFLNLNEFREQQKMAGEILIEAYEDYLTD